LLPSNVASTTLFRNVFAETTPSAIDPPTKEPKSLNFCSGSPTALFTAASGSKPTLSLTDVSDAEGFSEELETDASEGSFFLRQNLLD